MPGERGYIVVRIEQAAGEYLKRLAFASDAGEGRVQFHPLGVVHAEAGTQVLAWDCSTRELPRGADRVWVSGAIRHETGKPFDIAASPAPEVLKHLSERHGINWSSYSEGGITIVFNDSIFLEAMVAPTEAMGRLLLSPFSDPFIRLTVRKDRIAIELDAQEFGFGISSKHEFAINRAEARCLAFWLGTTQKVARLAELRSTGRRRMLTCAVDGLKIIGATAIRVGRFIFLQTAGDRRVEYACKPSTEIDIIDSRGGHATSWRGLNAPSRMLERDEVARLRVDLRHEPLFISPLAVHIEGRSTTEIGRCDSEVDYPAL